MKVRDQTRKDKVINTIRATVTNGEKQNKKKTYMISLCSRIHILTLGLEVRANDFFLTEGADE